ncbi:MAG TPA: ATP-binding protein [Candidatus Limnocylindria bacterium]
MLSRTDTKISTEGIESIDLYRAVIESAAEAVWITDMTGRVAIANAAARDLVGLGPDDHPMLRELLLSGHLRTVDGRTVEHGQGPTSRALRGEVVHGEYSFYHARTRADTTVRVTSAPVRDAGGAIRGAVVLMHDITDLRKAEREKEDFLSIVTHELKTPLTPLKSVAQLMRMRMRKAQRGERELDLDGLDKGLATIERQVDRMDRLVTDLLEVSRIGRGRFEMRPAPFDLARLAREVIQRWTESTAEEGRHRFAVDAPQALPMTGDQQRVEQVLMNLVGNAVKYSPRGGLVSLRIECPDGEARVSVSDEGIGIPAEEIPRLGREPFVRGRRAQGYAGVGIGLYLSRLIAEGHGGRVELRSEGDDRGTTAILILPR